MTEVLSHHVDRTEVRLPVHEKVAEMAGYLLGGVVHADFDGLAQRPSVELRPYQLEGIDAMLTKRLEGADRNLLDVGMGLGKTTMALANSMILREQQRQEGLEPRPTLWLSHSNHLSQQAMRRQLKLWPDTPATLLTSSNRNPGKARHIFTTLRLMDSIRRYLDPRTFSDIIVDESHHGPAPTYEQTIRYFTPDYLLGITGTAYRMDGKSLHDIFGETAFRMPMTRGMAEGWLAGLDYRQQTDEALRRIIRSQADGVPDDPQLLADLLHAPQRYKKMRDIIRRTRREVGENSRTIIFMPGKKNSRIFATLMPEAEILDSDVDPDEQDAVLERYRMSDAGAIITIDMASEGLDVPETAVVALGRYTDSRGVFEQQIARGLRLAAGKEKLIVLDFTATGARLYMLHSFLNDLREASRNYYNDRHPQADQDSESYRRAREEQAEEFVRSIGFRFTEEQIDIVRRMEQIHEAPSAPREWRNAPGLAEIHDVNPRRIRDIAKDLRLTGTIMHGRGANDVDFFYSPTEQDYIGYAVAWNKLTANWDTRGSLAAKTGRTPGTLGRLAAEMGTPFRPVRIGFKAAVIPPEMSEAIIRSCGREAMTATQIAARSGKNRHQVHKAISTLGITGQEIIKNGITKSPLTAYAYDDCVRLLEYLDTLEKLERLPEDYVSFPDLQAEMPNASLTDLARNQGIVPGRYLNARNQATKGFSPAERDSLRKAYKAQQGRTPATHVARALGVSTNQLKKLAAEMFGERGFSGFTEQEIARLRNTPYLTTPDAPPGHEVRNVIVKKHNVSEAHFIRAAKELGIVPKQFKTTDDRRQILGHYAPGQILAIVELARKNSGQSPADDQSTQPIFFSAPERDSSSEQPQTPAPHDRLFFFGDQRTTE